MKKFDEGLNYIIYILPETVAKWENCFFTYKGKLVLTTQEASKSYDCSITIYTDEDNPESEVIDWFVDLDDFEFIIEYDENGFEIGKLEPKNQI